MPYSVVVIMFVIIIGVFIAIRFSAHFNACKRVSKKHPGENIEGCPNWTLVEKQNESKNDESNQNNQE